MSHSVFISYRRNDSLGFARAFYNWLKMAFPNIKIFIDVEAIEPGTNFTDEVETAVTESEIFFLLLGNNTFAKPLSSDNSETKPNDYVVDEIASALRLNKLVVPILIEEAKMPDTSELPPAIASLAVKHALPLTHSRFEKDMAVIEDYIESNTNLKRINFYEAGLRHFNSSKHKRYYKLIDHYLLLFWPQSGIGWVSRAILYFLVYHVVNGSMGNEFPLLLFLTLVIYLVSFYDGKGIKR